MMSATSPTFHACGLATIGKRRRAFRPIRWVNVRISQGWRSRGGFHRILDGAALLRERFLAGHGEAAAERQSTPFDGHS